MLEARFPIQSKEAFADSFAETHRAVGEWGFSEERKEDRLGKEKRPPLRPCGSNTPRTRTHTLAQEAACSPGNRLLGAGMCPRTLRATKLRGDQLGVGLSSLKR